MTRCPTCHTENLHRSQPRGLENLYKHLTRKRPYRCHKCGWRGWKPRVPLEEFQFRGDRTDEAMSAPIERGEELELSDLDK